VVELAHEKGRKITFDDNGFSVEDENGNTVQVDSKTGAMTIEAKGQLNIKASSITIESSGTLDLKANATLTIRGSLVNIN
jgi:flagellar basal body rod protein FlgG